MESPKIEALYSKLHDKYSKLKNKNFNDLDKLNSDQEEVFGNYVSAAEEYVKFLKNENEMLRSQVDDLRIEVDSIRVSNDEKSSEYQKLWMEESKKNEVLHEEIERLQKLQENGTFSCPKKKYNRQLSRSGELFASSPGRMTRSKRKRSSWIDVVAHDYAKMSDEYQSQSQEAASSGAEVDEHLITRRVLGDRHGRVKRVDRKVKGVDSSSSSTRGSHASFPFGSSSSDSVHAALATARAENEQYQQRLQTVEVEVHRMQQMFAQLQRQTSTQPPPFQPLPFQPPPFQPDDGEHDDSETDK